MSKLQEYEAGIKFLKETQARRIASGFKEYPAYEVGSYNGIEFALATIELRNPVFISISEVSK